MTGYNQNTLESLNQLIWKNTPKSKFHGSRRVTIAVGLAFLQFEKGGIGRVLVQQKLGIPLTEYQLAKVHVKDRQRVFHAERTLKKARTVFEVAKEEAKAKEVLPTSPGYDSGACDTPALVGPMIEVVPTPTPLQRLIMGAMLLCLTLQVLM